MAAPKQANGRNKWDYTIPVQTYILMMDNGCSEPATANALGVQHCVFKKWKKKHPELIYAINEARRTKQANSTQTFFDFVYGRLPSHLKKFWKKISKWEKLGKEDLVEQFLKKQSDHTKMHLFFFALVRYDFNMSEAARKLNISRRKLEGWSFNPEFAQMMEHIHLAKKDFFESSLIRLVKQGDTGATIFANKTINRDRGYNEKVEVDVRMNVQHNNLIDITMLDLPLEVKKMILEAYRKLRESENQESKNVAAIEYKKVGSKAVPVGEYAEEAEDAA